MPVYKDGIEGKKRYTFFIPASAFHWSGQVATALANINDTYINPGALTRSDWVSSVLPIPIGARLKFVGLYGYLINAGSQLSLYAATKKGIAAGVTALDPVETLFNITHTGSSGAKESTWSGDLLFDEVDRQVLLFSVIVYATSTITNCRFIGAKVVYEL